MGFWRHGIKKVSLLKYDPAFWGAVFPMGMYTVATYMLVRATDLKMLQVIPDYFIFIALVAWAYQFAGLIGRIVGKAIKH